MNGVQWNKAEGYFEGRCDACLKFWPLVSEDRHDLWPVDGRGLRICRACDNLKVAERMRKRRKDPVIYAATLADNARRRAELSPEERRALRRSHVIDLDRKRAYQREWMRRRREKAA